MNIRFRDELKQAHLETVLPGDAFMIYDGITPKLYMRMAERDGERLIVCVNLYNGTKRTFTDDFLVIPVSTEITVGR